MKTAAPSRTAEAVCLFRALEQRRAVRILDDPYAHLFLGRASKAALAAATAAGAIGELPARFGPGLAAFVLARHRFIDDALVAALPRVEQVVVLGAGYDTRAERFASALGDRPVFELDFPSTSQRKRELVAQHAHALDLPPCTRRQVEVDFLSESFEEKLREAGFKVGAPTFFIWEGVSMYLTRAVVKETLAALKRLGGAGSELVMDCWFLVDDPDLRAAAHRFSANLLSALGEPVLFALHPEDAPSFVERAGFRCEDVADAPVLESRYVKDGRGVYPAIYVLRATAI